MAIDENASKRSSMRVLIAFYKAGGLSNEHGGKSVWYYSSTSRTHDGRRAPCVLRENYSRSTLAYLVVRKILSTQGRLKAHADLLPRYGLEVDGLKDAIDNFGVLALLLRGHYDESEI